MNHNVSYADIYYTREKSSMHSFRLKLAKYAHKYSIAQAMRKFACSRNTVRKWLRLYEDYLTLGIKKSSEMDFNDAVRYTTNHPNTMDEGAQLRLYRLIEELYNRGHRIIIKYIVKDHHFECSVATALKYAKKWGFFKSRHNKSTQKRSLVEVKKAMKFCETIQIDVKYLTDIPEMVESLALYGVPPYQITARDVATGTLWYSYAYEKSTTNTALFVQYLLNHLARSGVDLSEVTVQTDGGTEFTNEYVSIDAKPTLFQLHLARHGVTHRLIPPASPTHNSDVVLSSDTERKSACLNMIKQNAVPSHRLIEDELYAKLYKHSIREFLIATATYQKYFNLARYNYYKKGTPAQLFRDKHTTISENVLVLTPRIMDTYLNNPQQLKEVS